LFTQQSQPIHGHPERADVPVEANRLLPGERGSGLRPVEAESRVVANDPRKCVRAYTGRVALAREERAHRERVEVYEIVGVTRKLPQRVHQESTTNELAGEGGVDLKPVHPEQASTALQRSSECGAVVGVPQAVNDPVLLHVLVVAERFGERRREFFDESIGDLVGLESGDEQAARRIDASARRRDITE
jgi:hypothetical protein